MTSKMLVSGASGYLAGAVIRRAIDQGWEVVGLSRNPDVEGVPCEVVVSDWSAEALAELVQRCSPDTIVHLASKYHWHSSPDVLDELLDANFDASMRLWNASLGEVRRFVAVGSYFQSFRRGDGSHVNLYSALKEAFAAIALESYGDQAAPEFVEVQMMDVFGPGDPRLKLIPAALDAAVDGTSLPVADLSAQIYPVHVDDAASAIVVVASRDIAAGRYSLPVEPRSIREILDIIELEVGGRVDVVPGPTREDLHRVNQWPSLPGWQPVTSVRDGIAELLDCIR